MESQYPLPNPLIFILGFIIFPIKIENIASEIEIGSEKFYVKDECTILTRQ